MAIGPNQTISIDYKPFPRQQLAHSCPADILLMGGAAGGGKSLFLLMEALSECIKYPGNHAALFRRTFPELEKSLILTSLRLFPREICKYNSQSHRYTIQVGNNVPSHLDFAFCTNESDVYAYQCFHPDTEILTKTGWKKVDQITLSDKMATLNLKTRFMTYKRCQKTWKYDFNGDMFSLKQSDGPAFCVTPNHTIWAGTIRKKDIRPYLAKDLPNTFLIPQWANWRGKEPSKNIVFKSDGNNGRTVQFTPSQWASFLGWYLSEGSTDRGRWAIRLSQTKKDGRLKIISLLKECGINYFACKRNIDFSSKELCLYLERFGDCYSKYIPSEIKNWPPYLLNKLLESIVDGDGTWYGKNRGTFVSTSKRLVDDVGEIALKSGFRPLFSSLLAVDSKGRFDNARDLFRVYITRKSRDTECRANLKKEKYKGPVYCVTVNPYHTVLIRYKNRVCWIGQSAEYGYLGFDEATHFTEYQFKYLTSRVRSTIPGVKPKIRLASNPGNIGNFWVKEMFQIGTQPPDTVWAPAPTEDEPQPLTRCFIPAGVRDNHYLMQNDPAYINRLKSLPLAQRRILLEGDWSGLEGKYFTEFTRNTHVIQKMTIPPHWPRYRALDFGFTAPFACLWFAVDQEDRVYCYREAYQSGLRDKEQANLIKTMTKGEAIEYTVGDPSMRNKKSDSGRSTAENYLAEGVAVIEGSNSRVPGWMAVRNLLAKGKDGKPGLLIFDTCRNLIRELEEAITDDTHPEDVDTRGSDHAIDALRYFAMSRPSAATEPEQESKYAKLDEASKREWKHFDDKANKKLQDEKPILSDLNREGEYEDNERSDYWLDQAG